MSIASRKNFEAEFPQSAFSVQDAAEYLPVRTRTDLEVAEIGFSGRISFVVKDPIGLKYQRLQPIQFHLLDLLKHPRTLPELRDRLHAFDPSWHFEIRDIQQLIADFHEKNLLISSRPGQGHQLYKLKQKKLRQDMLGFFRNILFMKLPGWPPEGFLKIIHPISRILTHPFTIMFFISLIIMALMLVAREYREFQSRLPAFQQFFSWQNLPYLWFSIIIAKVIHELGHAITCRHHKADVHQIGVMVLMFTPTLYCDVTDSWMLKNKWHRILIGLGGPFYESVLASIALFVWWWTAPGTLNYICLNLFMMSTITNTVFNLNPLVRFDGYYILSDYLEIPNLKQQSDRAFLALFCQYGLGVRLPRDPFMPESGNPWLVVYAILAWSYRWLIMFGVTAFLFSMLKPYGVQNFAFATLAVTLGMMGYGIYKGLKNAMQQIQPEKPHPWRITLLSSVGVVLLLLAAFLPIPWWVTCSFEVEPQGVVHQFSVESGKIEQVLVKPGDKVNVGDLLVILKNPDLEDDLRESQLEYAKTKIQQETALIKRDDEQIAMTSEKINTLTSQIKNLQEKISRLNIKAACAGTVVAPNNIPEQSINKSDKLPRWYGTIFVERNNDAWIERGTPLLSIAPSQEMQAVLLIDQNDRNDINLGQYVTMQCQHLPGIYLNGTIHDIGERQTNEAPASLTQKAGGSVATVTDKAGKETLVSSAYRGIVPLKHTEALPMDIMGTRGQARVVISKRSLLGWFWRIVRQTFNFRL